MPAPYPKLSSPGAGLPFPMESNHFGYLLSLYLWDSWLLHLGPSSPISLPLPLSPHAPPSGLSLLLPLAMHSFTATINFLPCQT